MLLAGGALGLLVAGAVAESAGSRLAEAARVDSAPRAPATPFPPPSATQPEPAGKKQPRGRARTGAVRPVSGKRSRGPVSPGREGRLVPVPGASAARGSGLRYVVEVEGGLPVDRRAFARDVERILSDPRSWGRAVRRVGASPADFRVTLASATTTDALCAPLATRGTFSCAQGARAVLNADRWLHGASSYGRRLDRYRTYMVNHEVGHLLGRGHAACPGPGLRAPVMMQQTKGVGACRPNPWPLAWERG